MFIKEYIFITKKNFLDNFFLFDSNSFVYSLCVLVTAIFHFGEEKIKTIIFYFFLLNFF